MYDFLDPEIIALKSSLPTTVLEAEARGRSPRPALARLSTEELNRVLRINQRLIARHEQRLADLEEELRARGASSLEA